MTHASSALTLLRAIDTSARGFVRVLRRNTDSNYLQKKLDDHRVQTLAVLMLFSLMGIVALLIDRDLDPVNGPSMIWARLAFVWMIAPAVAVMRIYQYKLVSLLVVVTAAAGQIHDLSILRALDGAVAQAVMGFVIYPLAIVLLCVGFSLFISWACIVIATASPMVLAATGWLPEFPMHTYAAFILPISILMLAVSANFATSYHRRYVLERALEEASNTDPLTGVSNRRHFEVLLRREVSRCARMSHPCALLMLDIDHFKRINDNFGHPTGDRVIRALAEVCTANSRDTDVVARLGGEEFAIILPETAGEGDARLVAERIRGEVQRLKVVSESGDDVCFTVSIGIASLRLGTNGSFNAPALGERLISSADAALYKAKTTGRNRVVFAVDLVEQHSDHGERV